MKPRLLKQGDVCVLLNPVNKAKIFVPLEDVEITHRGRTQKLGELIKELDEAKVSRAEFDKYKIETKKTLKRMLDCMKILVGQQEVNSLDINELLDNLEANNNEKE